MCTTCLQFVVLVLERFGRTEQKTTGYMEFIVVLSLCVKQNAVFY
jgi:hypothetical protein